MTRRNFSGHVILPVKDSAAGMEKYKKGNLN